MPIKYKSTLKEIVLAKLKQCYGSKKVNLLQDNEITKNSPKAFKDAKTWEHQEAPSPWTPPGALRQAPGPYKWLLALRNALSGRYFNILFRAPHLVAMSLTSPGSIVQHIKDTYICRGLQKGA